MKIVCVAGGSYKSFYLNHFSKLKRCDLLLFNFGIIYDYVCENETIDGVVSSELHHLANDLGAVVVAKVNIIKNGVKSKGIIVSNGKQIFISNLKLGVKVCLNNWHKGQNKIQQFIIGGRNTDFSNCHKILLSDQPIHPNVLHCSNNKIYIFCNKKGVEVVKNKTLFKNNYKVAILKF